MDEERRVRRLLPFEGGQALARLGRAFYSSAMRPARSPVDGEFPTRTNRSVWYEAPSPISCISAAPDRHTAALTGKNFLHVLDVSANPPSLDQFDDSGARTPNSGKDARMLAKTKLEKQVQPTALKWGTNQTSLTIALGTASGNISIYSLASSTLTRANTQANILGRSITAVDFGRASNGNVLLAAASDGAVRIWDMRQGLKRVLATLPRVGDIARDASFRPENDYKLAVIYDSGIVQRWDLRQPQVADHRINAHMQGLTLDWHPSQNAILTGGRDKLIQVWNMHTDSRTPEHTLTTSTAVAKARWASSETTIQNSSFVTLGRSGYMSSTASYWCLKRDSIPTYSFSAHTDAIADIAVASPTLVWTGGRDGLFVQHDARFEESVWASVPSVPLEVSPLNEISFGFQAEYIPSPDTLTGSKGSDTPSGGPHNIGKFSNQISSYFNEEVTTSSHPVPLPDPGWMPILSMNVPNVVNGDWELMGTTYLFDLEKGRSISDACRHNGFVARSAGMLRGEQVWNILAEANDELERRFLLSLPSAQRPTAQSWLRGSLDSGSSDIAVVEDSSETGHALAVPVARESDIFEYLPSGEKRRGWGMSGVSFASDNSGADSDEHTAAQGERTNVAATISSSGPRPSIGSSASYGGGGTSAALNRVDSIGSQPRSSFVAKRRASRLAWDRSLVGNDATLIARQFNDFVQTQGSEWDLFPMLKNCFSYALAEGTQLTATAMLLLFKHLPALLEPEQFDDVILSTVQSLLSVSAFVPAAYLISITSSWSDRLGASDTLVDMVCHHCSKPIGSNNAFLGRSQDAQGYCYCPYCHVLLNQCSYCNEPLKGLGVVMLSCGHRNHEYCWSEWVEVLGMEECPAGCGEII